MQVGGFTVTGELGRGAQGVVYRARDAHGREVALKVLLDEGARRRFRREVEALQRLPAHPGIVPVVAAGEVDGRPWMAMELVPGTSLQERLDRAGPLAPRQALRLGVKLARALAHAHAHGVLHRDLKPSNVLLVGEEEPRLVDLGLVKDLAADRSRLTHTGMFLGTPGYWPPEQALGRAGDVGPASDVYALGATLFAALTGRPPFVVDSLAAAMAAAERETPPRPSSLARDVDPAVDAVILRCLEKDAARRFAGAAELAGALEACLAPRRPRRSRAPLLLGAAAALTAVGAGLALAVSPGAPGPAITPPSPATTPRAPAAPSAAADAPPAGRARELVQQGVAAAQARDWAAAERLFDRALRLLPRDAAALFGRGTARMRLDDAAGALADLDACLALEPDLLVLVTRAWLHLREGRDAAAMADAGAALRFEADHPHALAIRAYARWRQGDLAGARADATWALARAPEALALATRAALALERGELAEARAAAEDALRVDPELGAAWHQRGVVRHLEGDLDGALADLDQAARLVPRDVDVLARRARVKLERRDVEGALADAERAVALGPESAIALTVRGMGLAVAGQHARAEADLRRAVALAVGGARAEARYQLGNALVLAGRARDALVEYDAALRRDPEHLGLLVARAAARERLGDAQGAEEDLAAAVAILPGPDLVRRLVRVRLARDDPRGALEALDAALSRDPEQRLLLAERAMVREVVGDARGARADADLVLAREPDHPGALLVRARLREAAGDAAGAAADYRRLLARAAPGSDAETEARQGLGRLGAGR